jgi:hypothetical protein
MGELRQNHQPRVRVACRVRPVGSLFRTKICHKYEKCIIRWITQMAPAYAVAAKITRDVEDDETLTEQQIVNRHLSSENPRRDSDATVPAQPTSRAWAEKKPPSPSRRLRRPRSHQRAYQRLRTTSEMQVDEKEKPDAQFDWSVEKKDEIFQKKPDYRLERRKRKNERSFSLKPLIAGEKRPRPDSSALKVLTRSGRCCFFDDLVITFLFMGVIFSSHLIWYNYLLFCTKYLLNQFTARQ